MLHFCEQIDQEIAAAFITYLNSILFEILIVCRLLKCDCTYQYYLIIKTKTKTRSNPVLPDHCSNLVHACTHAHTHAPVRTIVVVCKLKLSLY